MSVAESPAVNGVIGPEEQTENVDDVNAKKTVKYDSGAADLEKVTDYAEEKEVISTDDISGVILHVIKLSSSFRDNIIYLLSC